MVPYTLVSLTTFLGVALSASLPYRRCSEHAFPIADHTLGLYPPLSPLGGVFSADITVGSQTLRAGLDTGSSNTWFLTPSTNCTSIKTLKPVPLDQCGYAGPRYIPDATFEKIADVNFNESYGNGQTINGPLGYTKLILGGLTIPKQEISAASYASVGGDPEGNVSGLIGLAYPALTTAFSGTDPSKDIICTTNSSCGPINYSPLTTTIFSSNLTKPIFAFALSRSVTSGGLMTIGGIPRLDDPYVNATNNVVATVPMEYYQNTTKFTFYLAGITGFQYPGAAPNAGQGQYIIDTGTSISVLPPADVKAINALFNPPAVLDPTIGLYAVPCNATAPQFGVNIGGQTFYLNPKDLVVSVQGGNGTCASAIQASLATEALPILGFTFLQSVLAVFDVGKKEMTFMSRMNYVS